MSIPKKHQQVENSARHIVPKAFRIGPTDPNEVISVDFTVCRRPGAPALPSQEQWEAVPSREQRYVTPDEFTAEYGAAPPDSDLIAEFTLRHNLKVLEKNADQRTVIAFDTVGQINEPSQWKWNWDA